jgi:G3E family GTPase
LRRIYGDRFSIAPLSVLVDPIRAERIFGLSEGGKFSEKVLYIYRKQLEEADLIVITKSDLLDEARLATLRTAIAAHYPLARMRIVSVRNNVGVSEWFSEIADAQQTPRCAMEVDYEIYAEGEALLGWLNATVQLSATQPFATDALLKQFAMEIRNRLGNAEIAHLKMTLSPDRGLGDIAVINLVRSDFVPELSLELEEPVTGGQLIVNLRAEADPEMMRAALCDATAAIEQGGIGLHARLDHIEFFRPGKPEPTHRDLASI